MTCPCQQLVNDTLEHYRTHYHAVLEKPPAIEILDEFEGRKGFFLKKYLIGAEYNMNQWRTPWEAIQKDVWDFVGKPIVLTPSRDHPPVYMQDDYKIGEIIKVGLDELKQVAWQISQIFDKKAQKLIREKKVRYGSPTVLKYSDAETEEMTLGSGKVQTTLHRFIPAHDAIVENPAYGKQLDVIKAICDGDGPGCALKLMGVSASVNDDNTNQLTIVPFVKKTLKANFNHKTLSDMVEYSKKTRQGSTDSCVSRKISILADEHPDWENDQTIAVAYSYCKKDKAGEIEKLILGDLTPEVIKIHDKIRKEANQKEALVSYVDKAQNKLRAAEEGGEWITVKGQHIFIPEGEDKGEAIQKHFEDKGKFKGPTQHEAPKGRKETVQGLHKAYPNMSKEFIEKQYDLAPKVQAKARVSNDALQVKLKKQLKGAKISGRVKDTESMIGKIGKKPKYKSVADLQDTSGVRAVHEDISSVKESMKFVRENYNVVEEDDYISKPKGGYRSYHAIIKDENGIETELQIRTANQNTFADWAHEFYKPPTEKMEAFYSEHNELVSGYSESMSDYFFSLDSGQTNVKKPGCPQEIVKVEMCL